MANITKINNAKEARKPYAVGEAICMACNHEWVAVWPVGVFHLDCPNCRAVKAFPKYFFSRTGQLHLRCACGCEFFCITPKGPYCINCGADQDI